MGDRQISAGTALKINWEGSLFVHHSLGMVNRELLAELIKCPYLDIHHIPYEPDRFTPAAGSRHHPLTELSHRPHHDADIHLRHRWPPDFSKPPSGKFILMQPWEYGSLPVVWRDAIVETVDEVWVYSRFLKTCYERSGIPAEKVKVVPCGIDPDFFNPGAVPAAWVREACGSRYCFLFNGGITARKGTDILVNAYLNEFRADEPVCLVIKDSEVYGKGMSAKVRDLAAQSDIAKIVYFSESIPHEQLPGLYTACDCYVHPYRAEGYGLPIAEAMACGIPVIVTGGGACLDFVEPDSGYFVKCSLETMKSKFVSGLATVDYPFWLVPDMRHLRSILRYVFDNKEEARLRAAAGGETVRRIRRWKDAAAVALRRFFSITGRKEPPQPNGATGDDRDTMVEHAVSLLRTGEYDEATAAFQKILLRYGEHSLVYEGLAIAAFHKKDYIEACNLFAAANRICHDNVDIIVNWYEAAKTTGTAAQLIEPVRRALERHPQNNELRAIAVEMGITHRNTDTR